jgi:hypothetical protein
MDVLIFGKNLLAWVELLQLHLKSYLQGSSLRSDLYSKRVRGPINLAWSQSFRGTIYYRMLLIELDALQLIWTVNSIQLMQMHAYFKNSQVIDPHANSMPTLKNG